MSETILPASFCSVFVDMSKHFRPSLMRADDLSRELLAVILAKHRQASVHIVDQA